MMASRTAPRGVAHTAAKTISSKLQNCQLTHDMCAHRLLSIGGQSEALFLARVADSTVTSALNFDVRAETPASFRALREIIVFT